jgi:hypothetical protein
MTVCLVTELPPNFLFGRLLSAQSGSLFHSLGLIALWLYGMRLSFNYLMNFVLPRSICVLLEIYFMHFVLFDIILLFVLLEFYYFLEPNRWFMFKNNSVVYDSFSNYEH